jgi:opacity protein-like surface antigen
MKTISVRVLILLTAMAGGALAQNSDLGLLLGVSAPVRARVSGSSVSASVTGGGQINYAAQVLERTAGRLYVELPLVITGGTRAVVSNGSVYSSVGGTVFFTPGVRWNFNPAHRTSFYAAVGGGIAYFNGSSKSVVNGTRVVDVGGKTAPAFGFGGGLDFRLTRLMSLRAEARDEVTRGNIDGAAHHSLFMIGVGLHF